MRLFVAFELPESIKKAAADLQNELIRAGSELGWVRPEAMHLTLKFLGETSPDRLPAIKGALKTAAAGTGPLKVSFKGVGVFPDFRSPRVVWIGIHPEDDRLAALQSKIEQALAPLGFPVEGRQFRPHLTLGRIKSPGRTGGRTEGLMKSLGSHEKDRFGECDLTRLDLIKSDLQRGGARYTQLWSFPLVP